MKKTRSDTKASITLADWLQGAIAFLEPLSVRLRDDWSWNDLKEEVDFLMYDIEPFLSLSQMLLLHQYLSVLVSRSEETDRGWSIQRLRILLYWLEGRIVKRSGRENASETESIHALMKYRTNRKESDAFLERLSTILFAIMQKTRLRDPGADRNAKGGIVERLPDRHRRKSGR